ncbi:MAG: PAC2 family protein [Gemmataceae bacterium]
MTDKSTLNHPWLVAVWPGMGNVGLSAGYYLMAKLDMHLIAEMEAGDLFDVNHVEVKDGIIQTARRPRHRFFLWTDPKQQHDLIVLLGEAQAPVGKFTFCRQIMEYARQLGVERVFTFAAMATQMHPEQPARVFGAATDAASLQELKQTELEILEDGHISGLNGVLLGVVAEHNMRGTCLLGEMPHIFSQLPFPKASLAVLEIFTSLAGLDVDLSELAEQARIMEQQLGELLSRVEETFGGAAKEVEEVGYPTEAAEEETLSPADRNRIETLFQQAEQNRSKAFELKQLLDRLGVFAEYEDRFLDLFKKSDS